MDPRPHDHARLTSNGTMNRFERPHVTLAAVVVGLLIIALLWALASFAIDRALPPGNF
jgi:hypothetical protein